MLRVDLCYYPFNDPDCQSCSIDVLRGRLDTLRKSFICKHNGVKYDYKLDDETLTLESNLSNYSLSHEALTLVIAVLNECGYDPTVLYFYMV